MNIFSWLDNIGDAAPQQPPKPRKRNLQQHQQVPTPSQSTADTILDAMSSSPTKRLRTEDDGGENPKDQEDQEDKLGRDEERTPRRWGSGRYSDNLSKRSSATSPSKRSSRLSPSKRLAALEVATHEPVVVTQIRATDPRMPTELIAMVKALSGFQTRLPFVPGYLAAEIETRARIDAEFSDFHPSMFQLADDPFVPHLSLDRIMEVYEAATECCNEGHAEATWNTLIHWPVFELALGVIRGETLERTSMPADGAQRRDHPVRVRAMPCTTARLKDHQQGAKMVDFSLFIEPQGLDADKINELRQRLLYINHTDYHPLRRRPIMLSAESKRPGEGYQEAQVQLGVWQAAQWTLLENLLSSQSATTRLGLIPFLPALIIQGHEWSFAATTRSGRQTVLWAKKVIGGTDTIVGMFQIIHALRHIAAWGRDTYWPWYRRAILQMGEEDLIVAEAIHTP
ncbi:Uu.00g133500.m01.CDS01 [Anthostomella pinea]|uniref:Uu.00g133500.m01.CDS01 n=1 Tax=Anthostomella pinea TaxID=933095 RepID=A0AAI8YIB7_9PEZI|nr:Uu.00g133500.m01.CDS01 [Anthostomella pinea]